MPLPQQVVEKLSREPIKTPGWSGGILFYAGGLLAVVIVLYVGLTFIYEPILRGQISGAEDKIAALKQTISPADEQKLATYYSQVSNMRSLMNGHIFFSPFLSWLEAHTEANVSYGSLNYATGNQITFTGTARTQADADQQVAVFQAAPEVASVNVSNLSFSAIDNTWQFNISLVMRPAIFAWQQQGSAATSTPTTPTP